MCDLDLGPVNIFRMQKVTFMDKLHYLKLSVIKLEADYNFFIQKILLGF